MLGLIAGLFKGREPRPTCQHPQLGALEFDRSAQEWQTAASSQIYHGGIPGDEDGPDESAIAEITARLSNMTHYWKICAGGLSYIVRQTESIPGHLPVQEIFRVASLSLYPGYWEICFETFPAYKWIHVGMQFEDESLISNTIDT